MKLRRRPLSFLLLASLALVSCNAASQASASFRAHQRALAKAAQPRRARRQACGKDASACVQLGVHVSLQEGQAGMIFCKDCVDPHLHGAIGEAVRAARIYKRNRPRRGIIGASIS